jgi:hypothetical protein
MLWILQNRFPLELMKAIIIYRKLLRADPQQPRSADSKALMALAAVSRSFNRTINCGIRQHREQLRRLPQSTGVSDDLQRKGGNTQLSLGEA